MEVAEVNDELFKCSDLNVYRRLDDTLALNPRLVNDTAQKL